MTKRQMPTHYELLWPTLKALEERGGSAFIQELSERVAADLALPDEILAVLYKDGTQSQFGRLASKARSRLKFVRAIDDLSRDSWTITEVGRRIKTEQEIRELVRMKRKISDFFRNTLGANLTNPRWSWGAYNPDTNQLFLRVWEDDIDRSDEERSDRVLVLGAHWKRKSPGLPERKRHIEKLRNDAEGYGVVCEAKNPRPLLPRSIAGFNHGVLLKFGELIEDDNGVYARIIDRVPVAEIAAIRTAYKSLVPDLKSILAGRADTTTKEALAHARVGQGRFRSEVMKLWGSRCCVTGSIIRDAIRASHIKPWRNSTDQERLDPNNGLPLIATLDALFDAGLITFESGGTMLISKRVDAGERNRLGLRARKLERKPSGQTAKYLAYHRQHVFVGAKGVDANETRYPMPRRL